MSSIDLENVEPPSRRPDPFALDIERPKPDEENAFAIDHYEILRVGPQADEDTIERVYRTLADRFHPDNPLTGDAETFLRLKEAYETLSNQDNREKYNLLRQYSRRSARFGLRGREFFDGVRGGQNRRLALLCLLYRQMTNTHEAPGLTVLDLEQLTGCTREEITSALWYLCAKHWATLGEFTSYSITAEGFDFVESKLEDRMEFRSLATMRYYRRPAELEGAADLLPRFGKDSLPVDIEPAITSEGNVSIADHYEILGLGPQADDEAIERVYRTLSSRFHPDNRSTGDTKTFRRIKEAYDTLSDPARRAQYNARRQRSKYSERFRLRGREFFEGIRGEQLRRLAVLCLLYRQAAGENPGLTVLDLEQMTGCTREELGSPLWYLRQKKWAHFGEFTEYSITAAGFDVVENKLGDQESARSHGWLASEDALGNEFADPPASVHSAGPGSQSRFLIGNTDGPRDSRDWNRTVESEQPHIGAEELPEENVVVAQPSLDIEEPSVVAAQSAQVLPQPVIPAAATAPEIRNLQTAGISPTDIFQHLLRLQNAQQPSDTSGFATRAFDQSQQTLSKENCAVMPQSMTENTTNAPERTEKPTGEDGEAARGLGGFVRRIFGRDAGAKPSAPNNRIYQITPDYTVATADMRNEEPSNENLEVAQSPIPMAQPEEKETANSLAWLIPEETQYNESVSSLAFAVETPAQELGGAEQGTQFENAAIVPDVVPEIEAEAPAYTPLTEPSDEQPELTQEPADVPAASDDSTQPEVKAEEAPDEHPEVTPVTPFEEIAEVQVSPVASAAQPVVEVTPQPPGVINMNTSTNAIAQQAGGVAVAAAKRVIFSMGGKGGVGKTNVMTGLAEWFDENRIPVTLLDLDTENKACGSLAHFFGGRVPKINIHTPAGLDAFIDHLGADAPVILADMGAGAGYVAHEWFDTMYPDLADMGVLFTAIGVVTPDPASVESVLDWAAALQGRVNYVVVENSLSEHADFTYWRDGDQAKEFQKRFQPGIVRLDNRLAELENAARNYGATLGRVAARSTGAAELQKASLVMRAQSYRRRMFAEFDKVRELLLP